MHKRFPYAQEWPGWPTIVLDGWTYNSTQTLFSGANEAHRGCMMPIVTKELSKLFAERKCRPKCHKCGRFIGVGGYYDVILTDEGWEELYSTCKQHSEHNQDSEKDCEKKNDKKRNGRKDKAVTR